MLTCQALSDRLADGQYDSRLAALYCLRDGAADPSPARGRVQDVIQNYRAAFSAPASAPAALFTSPGRTEIGGNHTDHQHGRVLAASVDLDVLACAAPNSMGCVRVFSEGYPQLMVDLSDLTPRLDEQNTSTALVRGVAAGVSARGYHPGGFDAYISSAVPAGSGLSSSAAYEVLMGTIFNHFSCKDALTPVELAQIGQYAESAFFGKPCGLMDQTACAVGGVVAIDFRDPSAPEVRKINWNPASSGHTLCIVDTGSCHADLTDDYAAVTREMGAVAHIFGRTVLREIDEEAFRQKIPVLRERLGDRAILRSLHFFADDRRAAQEADALGGGDFSRFLSLVRESGLSSSLLLQNTWSAARPQNQAIPLALALAEDALGGTGAVRVHGGGFAGTIQAFVPNERLPAFQSAMEALLGLGKCHALAIRPQGGGVLIDG